MITEIEKRQLITRRRNKMIKRAKLFNYPTPAREELESCFDKCNSSGFKCAYCNVKMNIDFREVEKLATFDHIIPLSNGGTQLSENLQMICVSCNVLKGKFSDDTFKQLLKQTTNKLRETMYQETDQHIKMLEDKNQRLRNMISKQENNK